MSQHGRGPNGGDQHGGGGQGDDQPYNDGAYGGWAFDNRHQDRDVYDDQGYGGGYEDDQGYQEYELPQNNYQNDRRYRPRSPTHSQASSSPGLNARLRAQYQRQAFLVGLLNQLRESTANELSLEQLATQEKLADSYFNQFNSYHDQLTQNEGDEIYESRYWTDQIHGETMMTHSQIVMKIGSFRAQIKRETTKPYGNNGDNLARIPIAIFDGRYEHWKPWEDLFNTTVRLTNRSSCEKMCRLRQGLRGEPLNMILNLPATGDNFEIAWSKLVDEYDNEKLIMSAHLDRMLDLKPVVDHPAQGLKKVANVITESLEALKAFGAPTDHWGLIAGRIIRRCLDQDSKKAWEVHTAADRKPAPLQDIIDFVKARARALERVDHEHFDKSTKESKPKSKDHTQRRVKVHQVAGTGNNSSGSTPSTPYKPKVCKLCSGDHWLGWSCELFKSKTPLEKREFIATRGLCYNCLGPHHVDGCDNPIRCKSCGGKHHTSIHEGAPVPRNPKANESTGSQPSTTPRKTDGRLENAEMRARSPSQGTPSPSSKESERIYAPLKAPENSAETASTSSESVEVSAGRHQSSTSSESVEVSAGRHQSSTSSESVEVSAGRHQSSRSSESVEKSAGSNQASMEEIAGKSADLKVTHHSSSTNQRVVLLATAKALVEASNGSHHMVRILIDQGSEVTFITEQLVNVLHLRRRSNHINILGIGATESGKTRGSVTVKLFSLVDKNHRIEITAHILSKLTSTIPSIHCTQAATNVLQGLQLADRNFLKPGPIDILIGADHYGQIIGNDIKKSDDNQLVAQQTIFGWIVSGMVCCTSCQPKTSLSTVRDPSSKQLLDLLKRFWIQEEQISEDQVKFNPEELECEEHFQRTHQRDSTGRYIVRLPLKTSPMALGNSKGTALHLLNRTTSKLASNSSYGKLYKDFIQEYESLGHMRRVSETSEPSPAYYLPHHGVLREDSITTKLRVVFNGSSKTSSGVSLNDILHSGGKLQTDGSDVLIWMRTHRLIVGTDIVKMFRQINIHPEDWDLQRILWRDDFNQLIVYQLTTVTYGQTCAPWLALRVLQQLVEDEGHRFPLAAESLTKGRYVDDIYGGAESEDQLKELINQLINLCMAGGMPLQKWTTNCQTVLGELHLASTSSSIVEFEEKPVKVLGLCWNPRTDNFTYKSRGIPKANITKRTVLSEIAQLYDPLGLIGPVIIRAKIFIQELWLLKIGWDDPLPMSLIKRWQDFREDFTHLDNISIPRWFGTSSKSSNIQLHGFADASNLAMGAVVYIRVENPGEKISITLVCAKTRVAPLEKMTIPRLELTAAVLLTQLVNYVQKMLKKENLQLFLWSDSTVALTWIHGHPSRWKEFIQNRVLKIHSSTLTAEWRHISGKENPADCASRGLSPINLAEHQLWWNWPSWLKADQSTRPSSPVHQVASTINQPQDNLDGYSTLVQVLRISARIMRFIQALKHLPAPEVIHIQQRNWKT